MVTWEQIMALPEYQQASPEKKERAKQAYLALMKSKAEKGNRDILGGSVVTSGVEKANEQRRQEAEVQRTARAQMGNMKARGVRVPEEEPLRTPVYDPVDLVVDAATGFMGSAGKAALKAGAKALAKNVAREVGTGAAAGAGMALADKAGAGDIGKLAAGLGGGVAGGAVLTGARRLVASLVRRGIPESHASRIVSEMDPEAVERAIRAIGGFEYEEPVKDLPAFYPDRTDESLRKAAENVARWSAPLEEAGTDFRRADVPPEKVVREPAFGVEDNPKGRTLTVEEPGQVTVDELLEGQRLDFAPEEAVPNRGSIEYDEHAGTMTIPLPSGVKHLPEGVTRGEDGKLYITIASTPRGKVRVAPEVAQAVPEVTPKVKAPVETQKAKQPWEMTLGELKADMLSKHKYKDALAKSRSGMLAFEQSVENSWKRALEEHAEIGRLPDEVLDDYASKYGDKAVFSVFRGAKEKGISGWLPPEERIKGEIALREEAQRDAKRATVESEIRQMDENIAKQDRLRHAESLLQHGDTVDEDLLAEFPHLKERNEINRQRITRELESESYEEDKETVKKILDGSPLFEDDRKALDAIFARHPDLAPKVEVPARKQPWEMTREEFSKTMPDDFFGEAQLQIAEREMLKPYYDKVRKTLDWHFHREVVGQKPSETIPDVLRTGEIPIHAQNWLLDVGEYNSSPRSVKALERKAQKLADQTGMAVGWIEYLSQHSSSRFPHQYVMVSFPTGVDYRGKKTLADFVTTELPFYMKAEGWQASFPDINKIVYPKKQVPFSRLNGELGFDEDIPMINKIAFDRYSDAKPLTRGHIATKAHKYHVENALSDGKPVPPEVLAEYPDLAPKSGVVPSVPKAEKFSPGSELGIVAPGTVRNSVKLDDFASKHMEFAPPRKGLLEALKEKARALYTGLFDETAPITSAVRKHAGKDAGKQVDIAIGQTRGTSAKIEQDVERLYDTVKSALRNEQEYVDWETYRVAKRMVELKGAGKRVNAGNAQEASEALARLTQKYGPEGIRRFDALSETVRREFDGKILDMARELGQISDETYNAIRSAPESSAYAAFLRIMDDEADAMGLPKVVMPGESVRTLKGGSQRLAPTLDATVVNLARIHRMADQMRVNNLLVSLRDQHPGLADLIRPVGQVDGPHPKNSFFTYDNGHKVYWQVPADIAEALQFYGAKPVWEIARLASPVTRLLRVGATLNPEFMFGKNPLRDMQSSAVIVGTPPVKGFLEGLYHVLKSKIGTDEVIKELIKDGGGSASMFALDREAVAGARARKLSWDTKGTKMLKHPVQFLRAMMELAEQSQRVGNYLHLKRQGKSGAEAAVEGARRGTLDFGHFGKHGRSLNSLIAFWNAAMREQDQLVRKLFLGGKDSMKVWMRGSLYLTAPAIALWYRQKDDPRYQELPSWRKYSFWNIVTPKAIISLRRPFALGLLFAGIPEAALNVAYKKDPDAISEWAKTFAGAFFPDFIPTAAKPAIEVATNKNFFTGREVVPRSVENLPEEMQVTPATSRTAEVIGKYLHYSPVKIDHLIRGYAAGLGKTAVDVADRWLGDERVRPAKKTVEQIPVVKGLVASEPVGYGSASVQAFYRIWDEMDKNYRGLKALYEDGDKKALAERVRKAPALVRHYEDAKEIQKFFSESWKAIQAIQASQEIDPVRKREAIDRIGSVMTKVARAFLKRYYAKGE